MLSKLDDYPVHQTALPLAVPNTSDRHSYDRYWFNGYDRDGEFYFGIALCRYPNLGILDCAFSIVRGGEQHSFHGSRRMPLEPTDRPSAPSSSRSSSPWAGPGSCSTTTRPGSRPTSRSPPGRRRWRRGARP